MTDIEQRAKEYSSIYRTVPANRMGRLQGYVQGATDQREIDIDKACKWLKESIGGELDLFRDEQDYLEWEKYFIKAMEEQ